jgi:hypothetical protein
MLDEGTAAAGDALGLGEALLVEVELLLLQLTVNTAKNPKVIRPNKEFRDT